MQWDAWGNRVDRIEVTPLWEEAARVAAEQGVVATAYERKHGELSRIHQFALVYLFDASTDVYSCPLAMTDGAAQTLVVHGNRELVDRALPRLTSRDPARAWTSGQWMTERTGGSDVAISETVARRTATRGGSTARSGSRPRPRRRWRSRSRGPRATRPAGTASRSSTSRCATSSGRLRNIHVNRLKDKLGTRMVPTAELTLDGAPAIPVAGLDRRHQHITPMLNITRTWNAVGACAAMRRGLALARDYAKKRVAFGAPLADKPLHVDTLAGRAGRVRGARSCSRSAPSSCSGRRRPGRSRRRRRSSCACSRRSRS